MDDVKILAINSFPVHGIAGLKTYLHILGQRVLPVPSVLLNGLTNMPYVEKQFPDFRQLLEGTFQLIVHRKQKVILCIGYIGTPDQIDIILDLIERYRPCIKLIITDPISGDHGKSYVPNKVIEQWPALVACSDIVFPNITELRLITGHKALDTVEMPILLNHFKEKYPKVTLVVTSITSNPLHTGILLVEGANNFYYHHDLISKHYGGTGDAFLSYTILFHIYESLPLQVAVKRAAEKVRERIECSVEASSDELLLTISQPQYHEK